MSVTSWYTLKPHQVVKALDTDAVSGLSREEVHRRLLRHGENVFQEAKRETFISRLLTQIKSPLMFILLVAGGATLVLHEYIDATVIFVALTVNICIGLFQESRASRAFEKLASSQERKATVMRGNSKRVIHAAKLVPGDVVYISAGSLVPADIYLLECRELEINEAPLTGESASVAKTVGTQRENTPVTEQKNMAWMGTFVSAGDGYGLVVATGHDTEMGDIAEGLLDTEEVITPIQRNVKRLAYFLSLLIGLVVVIIFMLGIIRGEGFETMLLLAIAVAVSVIPEGLPAAVTAVLAIGMEKILSRGGLVRNLLAAETLGSTTTILTDKTGTLTQATMQLFLAVTATGADEDVFSDDAQQAVKAAVAATDAFVEHDGVGGGVVRGRPIERAILERAHELGIQQEAIGHDEPQKDFLPFNSQNRFAASLRRKGEAACMYVSGAPGLLLSHATKMLKDGEVVPLTENARTYFRKTMEKYAQEGVRFVASGYKQSFLAHIPKVEHKDDGAALLTGTVFLGLLGFEDPIRVDVPDAIAKARDAGARVIMLTGDNPDTARSIATQAGIVEAGARARRGSSLEEMTDMELEQELKRTSVYARMLPSQKLRIVKLLQKKGEVVAMTGDGINDAPALKRADIGVAVGSGTEVAQEASDLILLNDSFSIIVAAIEEGRRIIDNLKKVVTHLLSTSFHEVFIIGFSVLAGFPLPVLPVQILWVNILEEGFLNFGFAFEPGEEGLMKRNPRLDRTTNILTGDIRKLILIAGIITGIFSLILFLVLLSLDLPIEEIRTLMFVVLSLDSLLFAVSLKHLRKPFWHANFLNNHYLLFALGVSILGLVLTLTVPLLRQLLSLVELSTLDVLILVGVGAFNLLTIELSKKFVFRKA